MSRRLQAAVAVLLLLLPVATSCRKKRPIPKPFQLPPQAAPAKPAPPPPLERPPVIAPAEPVAGQIPAPEAQPLPPPPAPPKKKAPSAGAQVPAVSAEPPVPPPAAPTPQLRPILSAGQKQELERLFNERLKRTQGLLASIGSRQLSAEQNDVVQQIRTFLKQAEESREADLLRANNLAERAEVLAQDLAKRLR
ncbi:MAG: hypothetical protein IT159_05075 [Bryobacterales bacterium]|nr:hypothetical protein [Bryobacterales bacterium]